MKSLPVRVSAAGLTSLVTSSRFRRQGDAVRCQTEPSGYTGRCKEWTVQLPASPKPLGMAWGCATDSMLPVTEVHEHGRVAKFNHLHLSSAVRPGDSIRQVNGHTVRQSEGLAVAQLQEAKELVLGMSRLEKLPHPQRTSAGSAVSAKYWGMTKAQVLEFFQACRQSDLWDDRDNVRAVVQKFVKPMTRGTGRGVAVTINSRSPLEVNTMISHCWDENAMNFFEDIGEAVKDDEVVFICFLALYQPDLNDAEVLSIGDQLGDDVYRGPFFEVLHSVKEKGGRMLSITNEEAAIYDRMWCVWEAYNAVMIGLRMDFVGRGCLFSSPEASSRHARCGDPSLAMNADERAIRLAIEAIPAPTRWTEIGGEVGSVLFTIIVAVGLWWMMFSASAVGMGHIVMRMRLLFKGFGPAKLKAFCTSATAGTVGLGQYLGETVETRDGYDRLDEVVRRKAS